VSAPDVSVVVPSHGRAVRLRWLLNALEEQTYAGFEAIVVHDYAERERARLLDDHPLVRRGRARLLAVAPGTGGPGRQRNLGWRAARAGLVAFVDDDCRPEPDWLERLLAPARANTGAVVQGATRPDPFEEEVLAAPHVRTMRIVPPTLQGQTCNILYPRALLEALDGFREDASVGEDVDLAVRARRSGAAWVAAPDAVVNHSIEAFTAAELIRANWKWLDLPLTAGRHPEVRRALAFGAFLDPARATVALALAGLLGAVRLPPLALLAVPYARSALAIRGRGRRERAVAAVELPGRFAVDAAEVLTLAAGSLRAGTLLL
jgi:GT2 family glycosyltransferase